MEIKIFDDILYEGKIYKVSKIYREWKFSNQNFNSTSEIQEDDYPHCRISIVRHTNNGSEGKNFLLSKIWKFESKKIQGHYDVNDLVPNLK